eukprot:5626216-Amphidinium_carterae.2
MYSDALHVFRAFELDVDLDGCGYIETSTKVAKTIKSRVFRNKEMVLVGMAKGVSGLCWAEAWLQARATAGLNVQAQQTLNPLHIDVAWVPRSMSSLQFTRDFKAVLLEHALSVPEPYGSHSCKAIVLSWLAKFGISHHTRAILGGHISGQD